MQPAALEDREVQRALRRRLLSVKAQLRLVRGCKQTLHEALSRGRGGAAQRVAVDQLVLDVRTLAIDAVADLRDQSVQGASAASVSPDQTSRTPSPASPVRPSSTETVRCIRVSNQAIWRDSSAAAKASSRSAPA